MLELSIGKPGKRDKTTFVPRMVQSPMDIAELIINNKYSPAIFENNYRLEKNFKHADTIALDFDAGLTLKEAELKFRSYKHIIATTKSHQIAKDSKPACDRFRVILFLSERITDLAIYRSTALALLAKFPEADKQCKDGARFFYRSKAIHSQREEGKLVNPVKVIPIKETEAPSVQAMPLESKGKLARSTYEFLLTGAKDNWNSKLLKATVDLQEQGYTLDEALNFLRVATRKEIGNYGYLDDNDMHTITSQYERDVRYPARENPKFNFKRLGDIMKERPQVNWLCDGLLTEGGFSIMVGQPKSGKSTLTRQLAQTVSVGGKFLGRQCIQGKVLYLALEEQVEMLYEQFQKLGMSENEENILIHVGGIPVSNPAELLLEAALDVQPKLIIIDTMLLFKQFDANSYNEVNVALTEMREVGRKSGAHVCAIHHQNKNMRAGTTSILGSNAIHGAVDNAMMLTIGGPDRIFNTSQRGGQSFKGQGLEFDPATELYKISAGRPEYEKF